MNPLVSVIIVNWNGLDHLPDCLDSLASQTFRDFEVVLVDNGSTDGSVGFVRERYPWVKLVPLAENTPQGSRREPLMHGNSSFDFS